MEPVDNKKDERTECQMVQPAVNAGLPTHPGDPLKLRVQDTTGPPECKDWTPDVRRPDPQGTRPQDPAPRTRTRDFEESRTSRDSGLPGIQDYARPRTLWDSRLRRTQDFVGSRTSQKTGTLHTPDQDLVLWCSLREHKLSGYN